MGNTATSSPIEKKLQSQIEELLQRATKDALSGLLNRATMETHIINRIHELQANEACAFFIIDLDWFKHVNDTFGHQAGDSAIRESAKLLSHIFRGSDIVGRLGGDEFAAFMSGSGVTEELVREKARSICDTIQLAIGDKGDLTLTASVGVCMYKGPEDFNKMYQDADLALYKAKKAGKHTYCFKSWDFFQEKDDDFRLVNTIPVNSLLESLDSGIALLEVTDEIKAIYISPSMARMLEIEEDIKLPLSISRWVHPEDIARFKSLIDKAIADGSSVEQVQRVMAESGKSWRWWHIKANRIKFGTTSPVLIVTTNDVTSFKEKEMKLEDTNSILKTAFNQTSQHLWEVDLKTREFIAYQNTKDDSQEHLVTAFPDEVIEKGLVHSNSAEHFRKFADGMLAGQAEGSANVIIRYEDSGCYGWATMSYRLMYDDIGQAVRAIGIIDNLSNSFFADSPETVPQRLMPEALLTDLILRMRLNITGNRIEEFRLEGKDASSQVQRYTSASILKEISRRLSKIDREKEIIRCYDIDYIKRHFNKDEEWLLLEGHHVDHGGIIGRVRHIWHITTSPLTGDLMLNAYLIRVRLPEDWEEAMMQMPKLPSPFHINTMKEMEAIAYEVFQKTSTKTRAIAFFQISGLTGQEQAKQSKTLKSVTALLSIGLGGECIIGQYAQERLIILLPDIGSQDCLRRKVEEALTFVRRVMKKDEVSESIRFIVGIAVQRQGETGYSTLLTSASYMCTRKWNSPVDTIAFADENAEKDWALLRREDSHEEVSAILQETNRPLSESEKDMAFNCMSIMLSSDSLENSVRGVLRNIGLYYQADRVYILSAAKEKKVVTMPFEWDEPCKCSLQNVVSGMLLENFPLLKRCMEDRVPLFLSRKENAERGKKDSEGWSFTVFPLEEKDRIEGFLCIENPKKHPANATLFSTLIPYMLHERERFAQDEKEVRTVDQLMGLPDLRSYMNTIYKLNSDKYNTLGSVCIDIPTMAAINNSQGFEYGSKLLWYVSKTMTDLFGPSLLFRTWDAEFIAFCPNTTKEVFQGRCMRLISILQRRYPGQIRMGSAWADGVFSGRKLVDEARQDMHLEQKRAYIDATGIQSMENLFQSDNGLSSPRPVVYFQPQIDMLSGTLIGAEALVRGMEDDGSIIPPSRFIDILEEKGTIRELDLFVLDKALRQVDEWRRKGLRTLPVSVNYSRVTLLYPSTLASTLAIQSRYPSLPPNSLELEITEGSDVIENREFRNLVDRFRTYGLRIGLDDFGSRYANLSLFTSVTFDTVKLDRSLISELADNTVNRMLVHDIVQICRKRGMKCIAEGVETEEQKNALLQMGCHEAQGFYYDRPLTAEQFEEKYLKKEQTGL